LIEAGMTVRLSPFRSPVAPPKVAVILYVQRLA
jgi:hypothetical protein